MNDELNIKKLRRIFCFGLFIIIVGTGLHDVKALQFEMMKDYFFHDYLYMASVDMGIILLLWGAKIISFTHKPSRYFIAYGMDICIIDLIHITFNNPYVFNLTKFNVIMFSTALLLTQLILNRYWHWWKIQKII